ncbi:MAG TPA: GNAT family N-acetyltransferase [Gaiellaceae bacterium]|nr:GNAT family N-acetyltransferase [Gaiellaceae bacterium]
MLVRAATSDDLDAAYELIVQRDRAVFGESEFQRRYLEHRLSEDGCDCLVAVDGGRVAAWASLDADHGFTIAASDDEGAAELLSGIEARAAERGFGTITNIVVPEDAVQWSLLERCGFTADREVLRMWRALDGELEPPRWPSGVSVRAYTPTDGKRVQTLLDESYAGWDRDYVELTHTDWLAFMTAHDDFDPQMWFLAERGGALVACVLHWRATTGGNGWVKDLVVRESERGRGLGKALLQHGFHAYRDRGAARVGLKVDADNPTGAPQLYERVGFVVDRRYTIWTKTL